VVVVVVEVYFMSYRGRRSIDQFPSVSDAHCLLTMPCLDNQLVTRFYAK
jgi:hypothetical protein